MITWLRLDSPFPPLESALDDPNGLLAAGGDLSPDRILAAYRRGIFPWFGAGQPILWWSPDPRMVLYCAEFRVSRSLHKRIKRHEFDVRIDTAFGDVIENCATTLRTGQSGTWITPAVIDAYSKLHDAGFAHSVEAWREGELVGGLYGIVLDRVFFGESMFTHETDASKVATDASKVALAGLVTTLTRLGVPLIDCQQETTHLASFGARPISRRVFAAHLSELIHSTTAPVGWDRGPLIES
ncbi:MAG: leucyl/phenylalanyl-tRNA--protein transferase [Betaproteobacteria bacterium]|nr:MAG: leucyl/phenylalanyl-tRNA--protein transferase [Betaproteobacteria bacterium]